MANNILSVIWITDQHWSYYYLLIGFLLLIICFLLYRLRQLKKNIGKEQDYYHSLFDILDNLPFLIMVKDIQNSFRYYYWNKESELQSGIKREEAIGCTDYEIYGEERGRKYRDVDESLVQAEKMAVSDPMGHHPAKDLRTRTDCRQRRTGKSAEQTKASFEERQLRAHLYRQKLSGTMGRNDANCQPRERKALYTGTNLLQNKCAPGYSMRTMRLSESD